MADVWQARDTTLDRDVALKVLPEAFTSDPDRLARFEREAKGLASLNHPNSGSLYGLVEQDGVRALLLELVEGPTLADRIARGSRVHPALQDTDRQPVAFDSRDRLFVGDHMLKKFASGNERLSWLAGVDHRQTRKPEEILVSRAHRRTMLERERGEHSVGHEGARDPRFHHDLTQDLPMALARFEDSDHGDVEPGTDDVPGLLHAQWLLERSRVCADTQERPDRQPWETDWGQAGEGGLQPAAAGGMSFVAWVIGVDQDGGVYQDHR